MSKMFDALRRAEAERRRRSDSESSLTLPVSGEELRGEAPVISRPEAARYLPPLEHSDAPSANGSNPFPGELLRELGMLRNALEARLEKPTQRSLVFTSSMHGEGVTSMALGYSRLLVMHGSSRVLLVELNGRSPSLASRLALSGVEGVTHYFDGSRSLESLVQRPAGEGFDVIHVGKADPTLIQINLERALPRLIEEARARYDTVIIDAPPVVMCPETPPITPFTDGVVLVVLTGRTKRETVSRSVGQVRLFKGRVLGIVLNRKRYFVPDFIYKRL